MKKITNKIRNCCLGLFVLCFTSFFAFAGKGQNNAQISLKTNKGTLNNIIKEIESETDYKFIYSASKIPLDLEVDLPRTSDQLYRILDQALKPLGISYQIKGKSIVLIPSELSEQLLKEKGAVTGIIKDTNGNPMAYSSVVIKELNRGTAADNNGTFKLPEVPQGKYTLVVSFLGYKTETREITVNGNKTTTVQLTLTETQSELAETIVYGNMTRGQASALTQQKNSDNIKNVVSSEQFTKFPDRNAAEVVARIPSVSVDYDQGEGQNVQIRGLSPEYNSLTINGQRIPAPDPDDGSRGVGLDLLNQNLIESIEVVKAITPDIDGDAIGGSVNFKLKEASDSTNLTLELGEGYNLQHSEFEEYGKDIMNISVFAETRFFDKKLGILVGGSYYKTNRGSLLAEYDYDDEDGVYDDVIYAQHTNDYDVKRQRFGFIVNADYKFNAFNKLYINANSNRYLDDEIRRSVEYSIDEGSEMRETRNRREDQRLNNFSLGGENRINKVQIDYLASYIKAKEYMPDRTYWRYARDFDYNQFTNEEIKAFSANTKLPGNDLLKLNRLRCDNNTKKDGDISGLVNVNIPFNIKTVNSAFKFGAKYLKKHIKYTPNRTDYKKFANPLTIGGGEFGQVDVRYTDINIEDFKPGTTTDVESVREDSYKASENVMAGYGMFTFNFGPKFVLLGGARIEHTQNKYRSLYAASDNLDTDKVTSDYTNILPSVHVTYKPTDKINLRLAYSTGLSRPSYLSLVPVELETEVSDNLIEISKGNPDLKPTTSNNFDFMFERYTNHLGLLSSGAFYKRLSDVISSYTHRETDSQGVTEEITMPQNRDHASVMGFEVAFNQRLRFINAAILKDLTVYGNYTFTHSKYEVDGRNLPLGSSPKNVFNLALMYDNNKSGWSFVVSNVFRDAILTAEGDTKYQDEYYGKEYHLDVSIGKKISKSFNVLLQINNLTDQNEKEYLGDPSKSYSRKLQWEKYNASGMFTLQCNF